MILNYLIPKKESRLFYLIVLGILQISACSASQTTEPYLFEANQINGQKNKNKQHHTINGFKNLYTPAITKAPFSYLIMRYFGNESFADHEQEAHLMPRVTPENISAHAPNSDDALITWIGHSTFLIQYQGINLLTDPILSQRASPFSFAGPKRLVPLPLKFKDLPPIDFILISHNHYDHLDLKTVQLFGNNTRYLVPLKLKDWFIEQDIDADKVIEFDWWDSARFGTVEITATPSQHWSARSLFDRNKTLWAAWHIQIADFSLWFAGDTGYNEKQFKAIGNRFKQIDLGLIPIGAYAPRWYMKEQHVNPEEAVKIHQDINAQQSIGMHWGTFQLTAEKMLAPKLELEAALKKHRIPNEDFQTMAIGETFRYKESKPAQPSPSD